ALVTVADGVSVDTESVRAELTGQIARYKIPKTVTVVDDLPRTASGKVRKADLRARLLSAP
ncbi:AMP-binding enzyme, partial [Streptomyces roseofulvus]|nr:p-hydroxycinnamoyl-CoA synthetase [Streptomyces roseolus]